VTVDYAHLLNPAARGQYVGAGSLDAAAGEGADLRNIVLTFLLSICALVPSISLADEACSAALVNALRTTYNLTSSTDISEWTFNKACTSTDRSGNILYEKTTLSASEVRNACSTRDRGYFSRHLQDIAFSYLDSRGVAALAAVCGTNRSPLRLQTDGHEDRQSFSVSATWSAPATGVNSVEVVNFATQGPLQCTSGALTAGAGVSTGASAQVCTWTGYGDAVVALWVRNPSRPSEPVSAWLNLSRSQEPKFELSITQADDAVSCSVDGHSVAGMSFGQPPVRVSLNPHLQGGVGQGVCTVTDTQLAAGGIPCWAWAVTVTKDGEEIVNHSFRCCNTSEKCSSRGETITFPIR
jgi:hypothetical protein